VVDQAEIHRMARSEDVKERMKAAEQFRDFFVDLPDKKQAWNDLHRLSSDTDSDLRWRAADALGGAFSFVPDKKQAWNDLHRLTSDHDISVRRGAAYALGNAFSNVPYKEQAWNDLHRLTSDPDSSVRWSVADALGSAFSFVPDKEQAWDDLHKLLSDSDSGVRRGASDGLGGAFSFVPDKKQAWDDLHKLLSDPDSGVRRGAAYALGSVFSNVPDKKQAWEYLIRLTSDTDCDVRRGASVGLRSVFSHVPDKKQAWEELHRLTCDVDSDVSSGAADVLGSVFLNVPDKKQAWEDLHRLTSNYNFYVRRRAAYALGRAFSHVPDKKQAWEDLHRLTSDTDSNVRIAANHSSGKVCISRAGEDESEDGFRKEMENALRFFEKASKEATFFNPAKFCLPFYRSFYTLTFKKEEVEVEVQKYLSEAKSAVEGSQSKKKLLEAIENLGNALKEVQRARDFNEIKSDFNAYRRYCERACELLDTMEEKAPGASRLIRKGLPIIDERIKGIIAEIQEKAKATCHQSIGTQAEEIACATNIDIQKWHIDDQEQMTWAVENLILSLSTKIPNIPENKRIFEKIEVIKNEGNMIKQYQSLAVLVALIPSAIVHKGDVFNVSGVTTSDNSQTIIKSNENTNNHVKSSTSGLGHAKKTWIDVLNSSATVAGLIGLIAVEIGTYFYPLSYNHLISVFAAAISFTIVALLNRR
jgi:HEAT repeat protein